MKKIIEIISDLLDLDLFINVGKMKDKQVGRTVEGTIFEAVTAILVVLAWVLAIVIYTKSGDQIPTHFDFAGNPDGYGSKSTLFIVATIGTFVVALTSVCAYFPSTIKMPMKVEARNYPLAIRMVRVIAVELALAMLCIFLATAQDIFGISFIKFLPMIMAAVIVLTVLFFMINIMLKK